MASFRSKLERLGPPRENRADPPPGEALFEADAGAAGDPGAEADPGAQAGPGAEAAPSSELEQLRDKIARIMARDKPRPPPSDPTRGELPFTRALTGSGPLYRRVQRYVSTHRMGRYSVLDAWDADAAMLALLALDPSIAGLDTRAFLYVDTETTGLSGGTGTVPFLIGMARFEAGSGGKELYLEQLLLRQLGEEAPMLERFSEEVRRASCLVSYNGKSFDLPLLRTRLVMNRLPELPERPHLDLVHLARRVHKKRLGVCKLTSVEEQVLGFARENDVPSGEVVARYRHFLRTGEDASLLGVVDHNAWDIIALPVLVGIYGAPQASLGGQDLVGVSRTLRRSKALAQADEAANAAMEKGAGADGLRERAEVARARGERDRAVADLETLLREVDDAAARLALAKLYEHHVRSPGEALLLLDLGTGEAPAQVARRRARLTRKVARAEQRSAQQLLPGVELAPAPPRGPRRGARSGA